MAEVGEASLSEEQLLAATSAPDAEAARAIDLRGLQLTSVEPLAQCRSLELALLSSNLLTAVHDSVLACSRLRRRLECGSTAMAVEERAVEADVSQPLAQAECGGEVPESRSSAVPPFAQRSPACRKDRAMHFLVAAWPILLGTARFYAPKYSYPVRVEPAPLLWGSVGWRLRYALLTEKSDLV